MAAYDTLCPGCFVKKGKTAVCPHCGYDENERRSPLVLPHRTMLDGRYLAGRVLGKPGGFGITYLGWDVSLETFVAIKEYLPRDLAGRDTDRATVAPHSKEDEKLFRYGLEQFLQEARTLAKFDHANVVRVRTFFEENDTAYLVMDYYKGITLEEYRKQKGGNIPEKLAMDIMMPVLDGLREVHAKGFLHRDIKPQNIYLTKDGRPILIDFGAARFATGERSRSLSVVLTPGFAPYEQYHKRGKQGPWTDIYSCGATLYNMVTGKTPPEAIERKEKDELVPPAGIIANISKALNSAIIKSLAIESNDRPQRVRDFQDILMDETFGSPIKPMPIPEVEQESIPESEIEPKKEPGQMETQTNKFVHATQPEKESDYQEAPTNITSVLKQYWKLILFCSIGWAIGFAIISIDPTASEIGLAIGGAIGGLSAGLSIKKALSNFKVRYVALVTVSLGTILVIVFLFGSAISFGIDWESDTIASTIDTAIGSAVGLAIMGALGGSLVGSIIRLALSNLKSKHVALVTAGWAIGLAIGGAIGVVIGVATRGAIGLAIGFAIAGAIGITITLWQIEKAKSNSRRT